MIPGTTQRLTIEQSPERVQAALPRVVEGWGGTLTETPDGTRLEVPVLAGLRRGRMQGVLRLGPAPSGCEAVFTVQDVAMELNLAACAILLLSAIGAVTSMAWPWFPRLLPAVPLGLVLAVGGWLLIAARLRTAGPEELLAALRAASAESDGASHTIGDDARE